MVTTGGGEVAKRAPVKVGDVIEIETPAGLSYAQVTHRDREFGYLLRVLPGSYQTRPNITALAARRHRWVVFYPVEHAVLQGFVRTAGNASIPPSARAFPLFRAAGLPDGGGHITEWWLWDGHDERRIGSLKDDQLDLPIREIVNHEVLVERIVSGWTPRVEGTRRELAATSKVHGSSDARSTRHYLYFADEDAARLASELARARGFAVQLVPRGVEWLMTAESSALGIPEARAQLEDIAATHRGEYDGWEASIPATSVSLPRAPQN